MNSKETISKILANAFVKAGFELSQDIHIEHPSDMSHGDWACTNALAYAKQNGMISREVADKVVEYVSDNDIESAEVAGPGFINITLSKKYWKNQISSIDDSWGTSDLYQGQKWLIEHTSLNLFKPFSIGHLVTNSFGTAVTNIVASAGARVTEVSFPSDISPGIAKGVWAIHKNGWADSLDIDKIGESYRIGVVAYKKDAQAKIEIDQINKDLYNQVTGEFFDIYTKGRDISMEYFQTVLDRLGTKHKEHLFESMTASVGKDLVQKNTPEIFTQSQGAIIFEGSKHGLFDNVFINSAGFATYLAKDLGLVALKHEKYPDSDMMVTIADIEQKQHFQLVHKSLELVMPDVAPHVKYIQHGRLSLPTGRISSRDGGVPLVEDLFDELIVATKQQSAESGKNLNDTDAEIIAQGALRYALLKTSMGKNMVFDFKKSLSFEGDSGPYIQYTYVRTRSILDKVGDVSVATSEIHGDIPEAARLLERFPEAIEKSLRDFSPHHIANYIYELSQSFNSFYGNTIIADESNPDFVYNVQLTRSVGETLKRGLALLGIDTVERM